MKKQFYITLVLLIGLTPILLAQKIGNLNGIYYQAVAIDDEGKEIVGTDIDNKPINAKSIGVRFTISKGVNGEVQWEETHVANTDKFGLFNLVIGKGTKTANGKYPRMLDIPWIDADQFLKVEIAIKNDGNYKLVSNQQFMSVPYSFYTDDIADDAITTFKILDSAILNRDINTSAVDSRTILNETIQAEDIDTSAVRTSEILDSTIINRDIQTSAVDSRVILDSTIINRDLQTSAVDTRVLLDSTIINSDLKSSSVDSRVILDSTIINRDIRTAAIDSRLIANGTIRNEDIADTTIDLTAKVIGVLPVANGGTGVNKLSPNSFIVSNADSVFATLGNATDGQILVGVTDSMPRLKVLSGSSGIKVTQNRDSIFVSSGVGGFFSATLDTSLVSPGFIQLRTSWVSPPLPLDGVEIGNIVYGSIDADLEGCSMTTYVAAQNIIRVVISNNGDRNVNLGEGRKIKVVVFR